LSVIFRIISSLQTFILNSIVFCKLNVCFLRCWVETYPLLSTIHTLRRVNFHQWITCAMYHCSITFIILLVNIWQVLPPLYNLCIHHLKYLNKLSLLSQLGTVEACTLTETSSIPLFKEIKGTRTLRSLSWNPDHKKLLNGWSCHRDMKENWREKKRVRLSIVSGLCPLSGILNN
jgi:hypothetical protein